MNKLEPLPDRPVFWCGWCGTTITALSDRWIEIDDDWRDAAIVIAVVACAILWVLR